MDLMGYEDELDSDELTGDELDDGDSYGLSVIGDDVLGDDVLGMTLVGAAKKLAKRMKGRGRRQRKPHWRNRLAPGVPVPDYGVFPMPLTPSTNNGTFTAAIANIEYRTIAQVPFRGERLLTRVTRVGAAGNQVFAQNGIFIGIRPQIGVLGALNLENYQANSFGVRMVMQAAEQGAEIRIFGFVNPVLTGTDTLTCSVEILGRVAR